MADDNQLIISVSAETIELVKALASAQNGLQDFAKDGKSTAATITSALSAISKESKNTFDVNALKNYNIATKELRETLKSIRTLGVEKTPLTQIPDQSRNARVALYGLNQVVRDLPFGFIAISNNIPVLFDQLATLRQSTGGTGAALKELGKSLIGPAGVLFAFSAVNSIITGAIQKYGSLSKAINETFGLLDKTARAQVLMNEALDSGSASTEGERLELQTLVNILTDFNKDITLRNKAYDELIKQSPEVIGAIKKENATTLEGAEAIKQQAAELTKFIILQGKQKSLIALIEKEQGKLNELERERNNFLTGEGITGIDVFLRNLEVASKRILKLEFTPVFGILPQDPLGIKELTIDIDNAQTAIDVFGKKYDQLTQEALNLQKETKKQSELEAEARKELQTLQKLENAELSRKLKLLQDGLKYIPLENQAYATQIVQIERIKGELKKIGETDKRILRQIDIDVQINIKDALRNLDLDRIAQSQQERLSNSFQLITLELEPKIKLKDNNTPERLIKQIQNNVKDTKLEVPFNVKFAENIIANFTKDAEDRFKEIQNVAKGLSDTIGNVFINIFEDIGKGKSVIDSLTDAFKDLTKQLAIAIVKFAIFKAIEAGLTAASGGTSKAANVAIGQFLNFAFGTKGGAGRSAGLTVGEGGLALAGQVTFVQRGPDLVGVLQKANNRINRVG